MNENDPWYSRTEFWGLFIAAAKMIFAPAVTIIPLVGQVAGIAGLAVYAFGRSNVKAAKTAAALRAISGAAGSGFQK